MEFIDLGKKNIISYNEFEDKAKETTAIYIARAFSPIAFGFYISKIEHY